MGKVYLIRKEVGETPLQVLKKFREHSRVTLPNSLTYAGRLDPMAEGLLPIVDGKDVEIKRKVLALSKVYKTEIIFGVKTDTADLLGVVNDYKPCSFKKGDFDKAISNILGERLLEVPKYSTRVLSKYGIEKLNGRKNIHLPKILMRVKRAKLIGSRIIPLKLVIERLKRVESILHGSFRHKQIQDSWKVILKERSHLKLFVFEFEVESGTYIRSIAESLASELGTSACLFSLRRNKVGNWGSEGLKKINGKT